jgi:hypothetical protein
LAYRLLLGASCVCLPACLMTALLMVNAVNPLATVFLTDFTVENQSGEPLKITPVGTIGKEGRRRTLPMSAFSNLDVPSLRDRSFPLAPGTHRRFTYDWDDIQISEILIVPRSGAARQLIIDPTPTERQYHLPKTNVFVVPQLDTLPIATPEVYRVLNRSRIRLIIIWALALLGLAAPIGVVFAALKLMWLKREPETATAARAA